MNPAGPAPPPPVLPEGIEGSQLDVEPKYGGLMPPKFIVRPMYLREKQYYSELKRDYFVLPLGLLVTALLPAVALVMAVLAITGTHIFINLK